MIVNSIEIEGEWGLVWGGEQWHSPLIHVSYLLFLKYTNSEVGQKTYNTNLRCYNLLEDHEDPPNVKIKVMGCI